MPYFLFIDYTNVIIVYILAAALNLSLLYAQNKVCYDINSVK